MGVEAGLMAGQFVSLQLDALGWAGIVYWDAIGADPKYACFNGWSWDVQTVDAQCTMAFNPKTRLPTMSYYDVYNPDLKFASFNGSRWSSQVVAGKGTVGLYSDLRIDAGTGLADILYYDKGADDVSRTPQTAAGTWGPSQVTTNGGRWISRAVDVLGRRPMTGAVGGGPCTGLRHVHAATHACDAASHALWPAAYSGSLR
jgi:hypothetical protein